MVEKSQDIVALEILRSHLSLISGKSLTSHRCLHTLSSALNFLYPKWNVWVWRIMGSLLVLRTCFQVLTALYFCQQYFLLFCVRRSEIVLYVPVKEIDRKINLSVQERKRSSWKKNIFIYLLYVPFAHLLCMPCFETVVASLKSCWRSLLTLEFLSASY